MRLKLSRDWLETTTHPTTRDEGKTYPCTTVLLFDAVFRILTYSTVVYGIGSRSSSLEYLLIANLLSGDYFFFQFY